MSDPDVAQEARSRGVTRAFVSMEKAAALEKPCIFAIGNAPTALLSLEQLMEEGKAAPALIIGVPVGFVNVEISEERIIEKGARAVHRRAWTQGRQQRGRGHLQRPALSDQAVKKMEEYLIKDGKRLRLGYTTGSCAAAAKAAAWMLLTGRRKESIRLQTPKGIELNLKVLDIQMLADEVRCAIRKDSGDDPDVTRGTPHFCRGEKIGHARRDHRRRRGRRPRDEAGT